MDALKKDITLIGGIGQMSTTLLGTGLFMVPAIAASIAGSDILWAWCFLILAVCPIAITFATLGRHFPHAGGTSYFVRQAFGTRLEKAMALLFISVIPVGIPAAITIAGGFAQQFLPSSLSSPLVAQILTVLLLLLVNFSGSKTSSWFQTSIAIGVVALVFTFLLQSNTSPSDFIPHDNPVENSTAITSAIAVMFWCFVGIEAFAHMGEEFKNPTRDFPLAILIGCLIAGTVYYLFSVLILKYHAFGSEALNIASVPYLSEKLFGKEATWIVSLIGFLACFATINLYTQSLSRMVWSLAREYRPNNVLARMTKRGVPAQATLLIGVVLVLSCVIGDVSGIDTEAFLTLANGIFVLIYLFAMCSAVKLLEGLNQWIAAVGLVLCLLVFAFIGLPMLYAVIMLGLLWWAIPKFETSK